MVTSDLLQNLRDSSGHVRSPTESEGKRRARQISHKGIVVVTPDLLQHLRDSGWHVKSPTESEG